ncbi:homeobox protein goosecoid-2 isoform X1 [Lagenorhynchus albirostris]|uniref:homeobox protein goosecoid-2 isoform X1 n=1 Tax=Lagenorhynchus albirostris TaxID=27610 RepID=UPI0028EE6343|nr:homeobox protein goosecoid-2 isoform X1 [Lagenorhynchus albirostris]
MRSAGNLKAPPAHCRQTQVFGVDRLCPDLVCSLQQSALGRRSHHRPTLPNVQRPRWTLPRALLTRLPEAHPCIFLPVQLFALKSPVSATGKDIGSRDGTRRSTSLSTDGAAQSSTNGLPGHLQPSHLFPIVDSTSSQTQTSSAEVSSREEGSGNTVESVCRLDAPNPLQREPEEARQLLQHPRWASP